MYVCINRSLVRQHHTTHNNFRPALDVVPGEQTALQEVAHEAQAEDEERLQLALAAALQHPAQLRAVLRRQIVLEQPEMTLIS